MRVAHPGKSKAQRDALNRIGCGDFSPPMSRQVRDTLLRNGLIIVAGERILGRDALGTITMTEYAMPTHVHMQWCSAVARDDSDDGAAA